MRFVLGLPKMAGMDKTPSQIIDALGGTGEVARMCRIKPPSVSLWRSGGIPPARLQYLRLLRPDVFSETRDERIDAEGEGPRA